MYNCRTSLGEYKAFLYKTLCKPVGKERIFVSKRISLTLPAFVGANPASIMLDNALKYRSLVASIKAGLYREHKKLLVTLRRVRKGALDYGRENNRQQFLASGTRAAHEPLKKISKSRAASADNRLGQTVMSNAFNALPASRKRRTARGGQGVKSPCCPSGQRPG
jgi:hypothetical protein